MRETKADLQSATITLATSFGRHQVVKVTALPPDAWWLLQIPASVIVASALHMKIAAMTATISEPMPFADLMDAWGISLIVPLLSAVLGAFPFAIYIAVALIGIRQSPVGAFVRTLTLAPLWLWWLVLLWIPATTVASFRHPHVGIIGPYPAWLDAPIFPALDVAFPLLFLALAIFRAVQSARLARQFARDDLTRCRDCLYVLDGIASATCPECGRERSDAASTPATTG